MVQLARAFSAPVPTGACTGRICGAEFVRCRNLAEVSAATGRGLPLMTLRQWELSVPRDFEIIDTAAWSETLDFDSAIDVFRHLKATGVNALGRTSRGESNLHDILGRYRPALDGRFHITYKPFIMILRLK